MRPEHMDPHELERELAAAGSEARAQGRFAGRPDAAFGESLRERLLTSYEAAAPRRLGFLGTPMRFVPAVAAGLLIAAAAIGAANFRREEPNPNPAPIPSASEQAKPNPSGQALLVPSLEPAATEPPDETPAPTPVATPAPVVTPQPTPHPTPVSTPVPPPPIGVMSLAATGCHGGVVLSWSVVEDARFNHYTALRSTSPEIPAAYPPQGGAVDWGGSYILEPGVTSALDTTVAPDVLHYYRAFAFDAGDSVIAASASVAAKASPVRALGGLLASAEGPKTRLTWAPYDGPEACFSFYKVVSSQTDTTPSYLEGASALAAISDQAASTILTDQLASGNTYYLRVQAFRVVAHGGPMLVAESDVATYTVP